MELYLNGGGRRVGERCVEVTGRGGWEYRCKEGADKGVGNGWVGCGTGGLGLVAFEWGEKRV